MLHFENDYNKGAHPVVLEALLASNDQAESGYGTDRFTQETIALLKDLTKCPQADIFLLTGGTQTNQLVIDTMLAPYEGVIAADTGHISTHEAGAIEMTGHKVLALPHELGKISAQQVAAYLERFYADGNHSHMVYPGMVYISHPTEYGTLYSKEELEALSQVCRSYQIPLFLDGARLVYGLAVQNAVDLPTIAELTDVFYLGGTKAGLLCGEAVVFTKQNMPKHFMTQVKQHGALLAKGRLLGVQFKALLENGLYEKIGQEAIARADELKGILQEKGYRFYLDSPTNQQFIIISNDHLQKLGEQVACSFWEAYDDQHTVIRLATSWSTTPKDIEALKEVL
ncbi:threonine aldolase family protein [Streptococcus ovuberis]|uniref:Aminotransferase class I/II-fold pyridoxal phosphate-dependent enzyme n=1 Tax=Streptococcus ovuberis TaxID=1936207 RepID=A0A7X6S1T1_9STRE|nr:aminotransferase class I/II-fold pyridoxal phosphate-dependent enzyme [Streptococcus ovuberis]NKZ21122.1 aminotransferase class I/II-fold pyridoxal phosphate-dependent enzyme [Streptococcus ovuberis]